MLVVDLLSRLAQVDGMVAERSKSPMVCSMFETFRESAIDSERLESLTRKVPSLSS